MGVLKSSAPVVQTGKVYSALNQPEIFVTYTGVDTATASTVVDSSTKTISVTATSYTIELSNPTGVISAEDFARIEESTATKIAFKGIIDGKEVNVVCSASEARSDSDEYYKFYGPEDASGYACVVKVNKKVLPGSSGYGYTVEQELIALMKEDFTTGVTVGYLQAGSEIAKGTKVADLLQTILQGDQPVGDWKFKKKELATAPTEISSDWMTSPLPVTCKLSGFMFNEHRSTELPSGYLCFAVSKGIGRVLHIYQNGLPFDILDSFIETETVYNGEAYYMYVSNDKAMFSSSTFYRLVWTEIKE